MEPWDSTSGVTLSSRAVPWMFARPRRKSNPALEVARTFACYAVLSATSFNDHFDDFRTFPRPHPCFIHLLFGEAPRCVEVNVPPSWGCSIPSTPTMVSFLCSQPLSVRQTVFGRSHSHRDTHSRSTSSRADAKQHQTPALADVDD